MEPSTQGAATMGAPLTQSKPGIIREMSMARIAMFLITAMTALLPIFFIPSVAAPFQLSKAALAVGITLVAFVLYIILSLKEGVLSIPYNAIFAAIWAIPGVYLISALFASPNLALSFAGNRLESDTVFFMIAMAILVTIIPLLVRTKQKILNIYMGFLFAFAVLAVFQGLRFIFGFNFLSMGIFTDTTSNLIGKWNDLGIFFGFTAILSLMTIEGISLRPISQAVLYTVLVISLFFVAVVNYTPVWIALGLFALGFFIYSFFRDRLHAHHAPEGAVEAILKHPKISVSAIVVLVIAIVFTIFSGTLGNALSNALGISHLEARPSWQSTADILKKTYAENAILGSGPNTFTQQWVKYKPEGINNTIFWNVDFGAAIGMIPTIFVTTGLLGALAWFAFLGLLAFMGVRALLFRSPEEGFAYYLTLSSFVGCMYLWVFAFVYVPTTVITVLAFLFTGIFLASLRHQSGMFREYRMVFGENPRLGFVSVLGLTVVLIFTLVGLYLVGQRYASASYFQQSVIDLNVVGDVAAAESSINKALTLHGADLYEQTAAEIQIAKLNQIINSTEGSIDERRTKFQEILAKAIQHAQRATSLRADNYQNWLTLGRVYASVVPLQIQGAYDSAKQSLDKALSLAVHQPQLYLALAELETLNQNTQAAKDYLNKAITEKNNYTAAVYLLAQLQIAEGDLTNALTSVEAATLLAPDNPVVFFQLGVLRYNNQDYAGAAAALEQAVRLNDVYANARYFLGLSYYNLKRVPEAILQFERIEVLNPENQEVKTILTNLRAGKDPLGAQAPATTKAKTQPPIDEDSPASGE